MLLIYALLPTLYYCFVIVVSSMLPFSNLFRHQSVVLGYFDFGLVLHTLL